METVDEVSEIMKKGLTWCLGYSFLGKQFRIFNLMSRPNFLCGSDVHFESKPWATCCTENSCKIDFAMETASFL